MKPSPEYFQHPLRFPRNVEGPFYTTGCWSKKESDTSVIWCGNCLWCGAPESEAPELFAPFDDTYTDTYFVRQPVTEEETARAINAAKVCCVSAVRYGGMDRQIIQQLGNDPAICDFIIAADGLLTCTVGPNGELLPFAQEIVDKRLREWKRRQKKWWQFWR